MAVVFFSLEGMFLISNLDKFEHGGWFSFLIASILFIVMFVNGWNQYLWPVLVASAFANAADAAYASVREPAEGTMLTVFREIAHSVSRQLAHLEPSRQRLGPDATPEEQDEILAEVLERAIADGEKLIFSTITNGIRKKSSSHR